MKIKRPNETGSTTCVVRWMAETPHGWVGAWDREALAALAEQEERIRLLEAEKESIHRNSIRVIERLRLELAEAEALRLKYEIESDESLTETIERTIDGWKQRALKAEKK